MRGWKCSGLQNAVVDMLFLAGHLSVELVLESLRTHSYGYERENRYWKRSGPQKPVVHIML